METGTNILGMAAAILVNLSLVPQCIKSWKTKKTEDVSLLMYFGYVLGIGLWLVYGIVIQSWPIIISETVGVTLSASMLYLKIKYG